MRAIWSLDFGQAGYGKPALLCRQHRGQLRCVEGRHLKIGQVATFSPWLQMVVSNVFLRSFFLNHSKPHHCDENPPSAAQDSCDVTFGRQRRTLVGEDLTEKDFLQPAWQELQRWTRQSGEVPLLLEAGWGGCWPRSWRWAGTWGRPWRWRRAECKMSRIAGKKKGKVF